MSIKQGKTIDVLNYRYENGGGKMVICAPTGCHIHLLTKRAIRTIRTVI